MQTSDTVLTYLFPRALPHLLIVLLLAAPASAEPAPNPRPCVGYQPSRDRWGWSWLRPITRDAICDKGYAVFEVDNPGTTRPHWFNCCPLPLPDILSNDHTWADDTCPEGYVVTGLKAVETDRPSRKLHCTRINAERYRLGPRTVGVPWGMGRSDLLRYQPHRLRKTEIPDAIAGSFGRRGLGFWDTNGCTGSPLGSLFVGGAGRDCTVTRFQELFFKEVDSNSDQSYPITMYPRCTKRIDLFSPDPACSR